MNATELKALELLENMAEDKKEIARLTKRWKHDKEMLISCFDDLDITRLNLPDGRIASVNFPKSFDHVYFKEDHPAVYKMFFTETEILTKGLLKDMSGLKRFCADQGIGLTKYMDDLTPRLMVK